MSEYYQLLDLQARARRAQQEKQETHMPMTDSEKRIKKLARMVDDMRELADADFRHFYLLTQEEYDRRLNPIDCPEVVEGEGPPEMQTPLEKDGLP
jgi:hypothetical protein